MKYQIIRSQRRKTIGLQIKQGELFIRAPESTSEAFIESIVQKKASWIEAKIREQLNFQKFKTTPKSKFVDGGEVYLWGKQRRLSIFFSDSNKKGEIIAEESQLIITSPTRLANNPDKLKAFIQKSLEVHFKLLAGAYLTENLDNFIAVTDLTPTSFKIKKYKARWGSCNSKTELSFNYLLVMAPAWVFDYVIIHELCHIQHLNHSKSFWHLVESFYPNHAKAKAWLKTYSQDLQWQ